MKYRVQGLTNSNFKTYKHALSGANGDASKVIEVKKVKGAKNYSTPLEPTINQ